MSNNANTQGNVKVPGRLKQTAIDAHGNLLPIAGASDIYDDTHEMTLAEFTAFQLALNEEQAQLNEELINATSVSPARPMPGPYDNMFNGMEKVYLTKNVEEDIETGIAHNYLTQAMFRRDGEPIENAIFVINYDYELAENITIPAGCVLKFEGGSIKAAGDNANTIIGNNTCISGERIQIFNTDTVLSGSWNVKELYPEWFGEINFSNGNRDDSPYLQAALTNSLSAGIKKVSLQPRSYLIKNTLQIYPFTMLCCSAEVIPYWGMSAGIYSYGCDALHAVSNDGDIRDISIVGVEFRNSNNDRSYYGLVMNGEGEKTITNISIEKSSFLYYNTGILISNNNFHGIFNLLFRDCLLNNNKIGLHVNGNRTTPAAGAWVNCNTFTSCQFSNNTIGGALFENASNFLTNVFIACLFESNGSNYNLEDYNQYGNFGLKITNFYSAPADFTLQGCYIECMIPRRQGTPSAGEETIDSYVYPVGYKTNRNSGAIIVNQTVLSVTGCTFLRNYRHINIVDNCYVSVNQSSIISGFDNDTPILYSVVGQWVASHLFMSNVSYLTATKKIEAFSDFDYDGLGYWEIVEDGNHYDLQPTSLNCIFFMNGEQNIEPGLVNPQFGTEDTPLPTVRDIYNKMKLSKDNTLKIKLVGDCNSLYSNTETPEADKLYPKLHIFSIENKKLNLGGASGHGRGMAVFFDALFEGIWFNGGSETMDCFFWMKALKANYVEFKNCKFTGTPYDAIFATENVVNKVIKFTNCEFTFTSNLVWFWDFYVTQEREASFTLTFENCVSSHAYPTGATLINSIVV